MKNTILFIITIVIIILLGTISLMYNLSESYVCKNGHIYARSMGYMAYTYTPIFDDDGKPVKCSDMNKLNSKKGIGGL